MNELDGICSFHEETIDCLKNGRWEEVSDMQLFWHGHRDIGGKQLQ